MKKQETGDFLLFNKFQVKCLLRVTCHMIPGMEGEGCCGLHENPMFIDIFRIIRYN